MMLRIWYGGRQVPTGMSRKEARPRRSGALVLGRMRRLKAMRCQLGWWGRTLLKNALAVFDVGEEQTRFVERVFHES